jgi:hypothetical protein
MNRFDHITYDEQSLEQQVAFKRRVELLEQQISSLGSPRAKALALTKLEEVFMWIGKAIRDDQIARQGANGVQKQ